MLLGTYSHSMDAKGRLFIPAKWRDDLSDTFIITRGIGRCLFGMPVAAWKEMSLKISSLPLTDRRAQDFRRMMFAGAADCELDKQGRILLPLPLREYAGITRDVSLIGMDNRIELWSSELWEDYQSRMMQDYENILADMAKMGI